MDLGAIADVAIGIIFVWIVLSLSTIQIQEWITTVLDKRAKDMEDAIHEMLANPNLKGQFYEHPVIRGLTARKRSEPSRIPTWFYRYPILRGFTKEKRKIPSYIPSQQFALALFDIAITANTESSLIQQGILKLRDDLKEARSKMTVQQAVIEELNLLSEFARSAAATEAGTAITKRTLDLLKVKTENFVEDLRAKYPQLKLDDQVMRVITDGIDKALKEAARLKGEMDDVVKLQPKLDEGASLTKLRHGVAALSVISPEVHQSLSALLVNVEEYAADKEKLLAAARSNVEKWFNDSMDRVSGVFKRYSQTMALLIGLICALLLNVDSIDLTIYLWRDPSVRQVLAARAAQLQSVEPGTDSNPQQTYEDLTAELQDLNLPVGWGITDNDGAGSCALFPREHQSFGIPVIGTSKCLSSPQPTNQTNLLLKMLGIFITALAARLGAPFWFDVLKRAVNLRGTGANPAEKPSK
jgi:hypothetical protein